MRSLAALLLTATVMVAAAQDKSCSDPLAVKSHALLQRGLASSLSSAPTKIKLDAKFNKTYKTNPSGAAAPLNEEGYNAVADRCCQAEMEEFIRRVIFDQALQLCSESGLLGFTPWHSCGAADRSFDRLVAELLAAPSSPCPWVQTSGTSCQPLPGPPSCLDFPNIPPRAHCQCSRSGAAKVNFQNAKVSQSNLGGTGPDSGLTELRFVGNTAPSAGVSSTGQLFDIVITTDDADYTGSSSATSVNGLWRGSADFGVIFTTATASSGIETNFKFKFVEPGTNNPVTVSEVHMTVFDLDGAPNYEVTSSKGYTGYVTTPDTNLLASKLPDGRTRFTGTANMNANNLKANGANGMNNADKQATVMYFYTDVSSFELQFGRTRSGGPSGLLFAFDSSLNELCGE